MARRVPDAPPEFCYGDTVNRGFVHPGATCRRCDDGGDVIADDESGFYVCRSCGTVQDNAQVVFSIASLSVRARKSVYKRIHHWGERMSQWVGTEPAIPADIFSLIQSEAKKPTYGGTYDRSTIRRILKAVDVPPWLQEKYRSQKFRKLPMKTLKRFGEKWISIKSRLSESGIQKPNARLMSKMREGFLEIQAPFERLRHKAACSGSETKCHKKHGCRNNMLHYNFVILNLIERFGSKEEAVTWRHCFPQISSTKKTKLVEIWTQIVDEVGWDKPPTRRFTPADVAPVLLAKSTGTVRRRGPLSHQEIAELFPGKRTARSRWLTKNLTLKQQA